LLAAMLATGLPILGNVFIVNVVVAAMLFPFAFNYTHGKHPEMLRKKKWVSRSY
jgi:hypothetical protein